MTSHLSNLVPCIIVVGSLETTAHAACLANAGCSMPLVLAFGFAFHVLTGTPMQPSLQRFYLLIFRLPGMSVINDKTWSAVVTVNLAYYIGLFVYAIFLGTTLVASTEASAVGQGCLERLLGPGLSILPRLSCLCLR